MKRGLSIWLLTACFSEVQPLPEREALDAWRTAQGVAAEGNFSVAVHHVDRALEKQPGDVNLRAWRAEWTAQQGDRGDAIVQYDSLLDDHPLYDQARYRRAVLRASLGDVAGCANDLKVLLGNGAVTRAELRQEPAWSSLRQRPEMAFLNPEPPLVTVRWADQAVYAGSEFVWDVMIQGEVLDGLALSARIEGSVDWLASEERWESLDGAQRVSAQFRFRANSAGALVQGPLHVDTSIGRITVEALEGEVIGPVDAGSTQQNLSVYLPSLRFKHLSGSGSWRHDGGDLWLRLLSGEEVEWSPPLGFAPNVHTVFDDKKSPMRLLVYPGRRAPSEPSVASFGNPRVGFQRHTWPRAQSLDE